MSWFRISLGMPHGPRGKLPVPTAPDCVPNSPNASRRSASLMAWRTRRSSKGGFSACSVRCSTTNTELEERTRLGFCCTVACDRSRSMLGWGNTSDQKTRLLSRIPVFPYSPPLRLTGGTYGQKRQEEHTFSREYAHPPSACRRHRCGG